jgi:hypothetical protein
MATEVANKARLCLARGAINFGSDSFKIILMDTGFTFDEDAHEAYADVSASELGTGFGYTQNTKTLTGVTVTENDVNDRCEITCNDVIWTAAGGDIGPTPGAIIFDDTVTVSGDVPDDPIIGYIDFGSEVTQASGGSFTIMNIQIDI